jgi:hypothetical protein
MGGWKRARNNWVGFVGRQNSLPRASLIHTNTHPQEISHGTPVRNCHSLFVRNHGSLRVRRLR